MKTTKQFTLAALLAFALAGAAARADSVPGLINYQGVLRTAEGNNYAAGAYAGQFRLWTAATGGTAVWGKAYSFNVIADGRFNVILGDVGTELSPPITNRLAEAIINNTNTLYLALVITRTPIGTVSPAQELAPRQQLVSFAYALRTSAADSAAAVGGKSDFFDVSGLNRTNVPAGGLRMVGLSNGVLAYLPATVVGSALTVETNLTLASPTAVTLAGGLRTDLIRGPAGGTLSPGGRIKMFSSYWVQVPLGVTQSAKNYDCWVLVQLPSLARLTGNPDSDYSIYISINGTDTELFHNPGLVMMGSERCLSYPVPANASWRVYSKIPYPDGSPITVYYLGANGSL
jgi:hypothetical protein